MDIVQIIGLLSTGGVIASIIQHFLNRSNTISERNYSFQKEKYFKYQKVAERLIEKLILLDNHRDVFIRYVQLSFDESIQKGSKFIDLNDTFNKEKFESNQEEIATLIFLYFPEIKEKWNTCLDGMGKLHMTAYKIPLNKSHGLNIEWEDLISNFNKINIDIGDLPSDISEDIKKTILKLEKDILKQDSKFKIN